MEILIDQISGNMQDIEEMKKQSQDCARVCYSEDVLTDLHKEPAKNGLLNTLLKNGHHSPFDHPHITLDIRNIPKIGAMILNNERPYVTSEKSARYTTMKLKPEQQALYDKWMEIFEQNIMEAYPESDYPGMYQVRKEGDPTPVEKLAQENARYVTSIDTPTFMPHTLSLRKLNETIHSYERSLQELPETRLNSMIKGFMQEFIDNPVIQSLEVPNLRHKSNKLINFIADRSDYAEEFGENYSVNYEQTFAYLAQAHRHRTLNHNIQPLGDDDTQWNFFTPSIIRHDSGLITEWQRDIKTVAQTDIPQGTMIKIHENGNYQEFIWKGYERLCGNAQWEIMDRTKKTLDKYTEATKETNPAVHKILTQYEKGPRCTFPDHQCEHKCNYGPAQALTRKI